MQNVDYVVLLTFIKMFFVDSDMCVRLERLIGTAVLSAGNRQQVMSCTGN